MASTEYDPDEFIDIALSSIFPSTEEIDSEILKEITVFLEESDNKVPIEDAEMVRGEIRKALIHFKNRPYLFKTRKKMEELLKIDPEAKVLIASGHSPDGPTTEVLEDGARAFVHKPYDMTQILRTVREVLDKS